jgi:hypothetical protein
MVMGVSLLAMAATLGSVRDNPVTETPPALGAVALTHDRHESVTEPA